MLGFHPRVVTAALPNTLLGESVRAWSNKFKQARNGSAEHCQTVYARNAGRWSLQQTRIAHLSRQQTWLGSLVSSSPGRSIGYSLHSTVIPPVSSKPDPVDSLIPWWWKTRPTNSNPNIRAKLASAFSWTKSPLLTVERNIQAGQQEGDHTQYKRNVASTAERRIPPRTQPLHTVCCLSVPQLESKSKSRRPRYSRRNSCTGKESEVGARLDGEKARFQHRSGDYRTSPIPQPAAGQQYPIVE